MADAANASAVASTQWLERTLDDSADRRISLPEGFLCADAILRLAQNVTAGLCVNEAIVEKSLREYLPFLATENLLMEAVRRGGNRQALHEIIRRCSMETAQRMKAGEDCDLIARLAATGAFGLTETELEALLRPQDYVGRCVQQVDALLRKYRAAYGEEAVRDTEISV
jgi:adenylosuccinate lyase